MNGTERLYYALGELAYAVAQADGNIQQSEKQALHDMVVKETGKDHHGFDVSEIIFGILQKDAPNLEKVYGWALREMELYRQHLTDEMRITFVTTLERVARAFDAVSVEERKLLDRFQRDLDAI